MKAGVLALQGDFREHAAMFAVAGATSVLVRTPEELAEVDVLAIPGGESTTISKLARLYGLVDPVRERARLGMPVLGTCAGLIMLDRDHLGLMDIRAERNAFGRQVRSFEADLDFPGMEGGPVRAVFIRAPWIAEAGDDVTILAEVDGHPIAAEQGEVLAVSFHPELTGEARLHARFLERVRARLASPR